MPSCANSRICRSYDDIELTDDGLCLRCDSFYGRRVHIGSCEDAGCTICMKSECPLYVLDHFGCGHHVCANCVISYALNDILYVDHDKWAKDLAREHREPNEYTAERNKIINVINGRFVACPSCGARARSADVFVEARGG